MQKSKIIKIPYSLHLPEYSLKKKVLKLLEPSFSYTGHLKLPFSATSVCGLSFNVTFTRGTRDRFCIYCPGWRKVASLPRCSGSYRDCSGASCPMDPDICKELVDEA